jgi:hypothetical protein
VESNFGRLFYRFEIRQSQKKLSRFLPEAQKTTPGLGLCPFMTAM